MSANIQFISAGAGSGKTHRLTEELKGLLLKGDVQPSGVIATTFTRLAASELRERVRQALLENGNQTQAARMGQALIGTVNGVCGELLLRFAFEAGLSPDQKVLEEEEAVRLFGESLETVLTDQTERIRELNALSRRLGLIENQQPEWRKEVMQVANTARANNMSPDEIRNWGQSSADSLLEWFRKPIDKNRDLDFELLGAVNTALGAIDLELDSTKGTARYVQLLKGVQVALSHHRLTWTEWVKLSKAAPTKKSALAAEPVQIIAGDFEKHPLLHEDNSRFCVEIFQLAADSINAYQSAKAKQGLLDFVDQEQRLYLLLENEHVQTTLRDELQVLLVDEFQDTSPIQLALFMKLAGLADRVIWVGDLKQAIYGFRGSDPELMKATLKTIMSMGGDTDVLPYSWRSRPALVNYVNQIFVPAFSDIMPVDQITLEPKRKELSDAAAVEFWRLQGSNIGKRGRDLADGIRQLLSESTQVVDKATDVLRPMHYGDIAILCRTNDNLKSVAGACAEAGIPVAFRRPGLLSTPEGALAMACLRRLTDPRDTLASAEIRTLTLEQSPADWLPGRLAFLQSDAPAWQWGEVGDDALPSLQRLAEARSQLTLMSPTEGLALALLKGNVRRTAITWGPDSNHTQHRLRNLDLMLEYAAAYEGHCNTRNLAATLPGLILWFNQLRARDEDWQAETGDGRAVTLVTHHRAKGLEWPVVIALGLESDLRTRLWGLTVIPRDEGINVEAPLADRRLQYWPWPFAAQKKGISVAERIETDEIGIRAHANAVEETRRLLYVSLTRARDLLIIPLGVKKQGGEWLDTLGADWMLPQSDQLELPNGDQIPSRCRELEAPDAWEVIDTARDPAWVASMPVGEPMLPRDLSPSSAEPVENVVIGEPVDLGERIRLDGLDDVTGLGLVMHSLIAAEIQMPDDDHATRTKRQLDEWGFGESVDSQAALAAARRFIDWITENLQPTAWLPEHPVTRVLASGQVVSGFIDLLLETKNGWVIIDHKATPKPRNEWKEIAHGYSGQLLAYKQAIEAATNQPVIQTWLHFPVGGGLIKLEAAA